MGRREISIKYIYIYILYIVYYMYIIYILYYIYVFLFFSKPYSMSLYANLGKIIYIPIYTYMYIYICNHLCDYLKKISIKTNWRRKWPKWNLTLKKRRNCSSCTKLTLSASWTNGLIVQLVRAFERNSVVVGWNSAQHLDQLSIATSKNPSVISLFTPTCLL